MESTLERRIEKAAAEPLRSRGELFSLLLKTQVFLLYVADRPAAAGEERSIKPGEMLSLWSEADPAYGAIWTPVFCAPEAVSAYVARRRIRAPAGRHLNWMRHGAAWVFRRLLEIPCFAGVLLEPWSGKGLRLEWTDVSALSDGRRPEDEPPSYCLPGRGMRLPEGCRCLLGSSDGLFGLRGRPAMFPDGRPFEAEDLRRIVRFSVNGLPAWSPCRHLASAVRACATKRGGERYEQTLLECLLEFRMFGEAEAFCRALLRRAGRKPFATAALSRVLLRSGRLESCIDLCRAAIARFPGERGLYLSQALAHAQMDDLERARDVCSRAIRRFPGDPAFLRFLPAA